MSPAAPEQKKHTSSVVSAGNWELLEIGVDLAAWRGALDACGTGDNLGETFRILCLRPRKMLRGQRAQWVYSNAGSAQILRHCCSSLSHRLIRNQLSGVAIRLVQPYFPAS